MSEQKQLFKVTIDNITVEVEPGTTILQAARKVGSTSCDVLLHKAERQWW
jgi:predicted molibdopterin-dependent oxidoreductase YjgC